MLKLTHVPFPELSTARLCLRKASLKDANAYHQLLSCAEIAKFSDVPANPTKKRSERFVSWMSKLQPRGKGVGWIIESINSKSVLGAIRINSIEKKAQCGMIGYEIHPDHWGQGFATEALSSVVVFAHTELELNRLEAWTVVGNEASNRVLAKCGFLHEGVQREKAQFNGALHTLNLYGRLAKDTLPKVT